MKGMENGRIAKRVYVEECAGSRSVGRPRKRWTDTVKDFLKKRGLNVRQARIMVHDSSVWRGFVRELDGACPGNEPLTLTRCYSYEMSQPYEDVVGQKSVCGQTHNLRA